MHHGNILKIKEVFQEDGYFYLIMEYAEGDTLRQYLSKHRVSDDEIIEIMKVTILTMASKSSQPFNTSTTRGTCTEM